VSIFDTDIKEAIDDALVAANGEAKSEDGDDQ
jgi:hypothetical protein